jgi:hypothetical protein
MTSDVLYPEFVNARDMAEKRPNTFEVPSNDDIYDINTGDCVKVCAGYERFWVKVTAVELTANIGLVFEGVIDNVLMNTGDHGLKLGDLVRLYPRHIYDIVRSSRTSQT